MRKIILSYPRILPYTTSADTPCALFSVFKIPFDEKCFQVEKNISDSRCTNAINNEFRLLLKHLVPKTEFGVNLTLRFRTAAIYPLNTKKSLNELRH